MTRCSVVGLAATLCHTVVVRGTAPAARGAAAPCQGSAAACPPPPHHDGRGPVPPHGGQGAAPRLPGTRSTTT